MVSTNLWEFFECLGESYRQQTGVSHMSSNENQVIISSYQVAKTELERVWIEKTMQDCKYNQSKAAKRLDMSRGSLRMKLKEHFGNRYFRDSE